MSLSASLSNALSGLTASSRAAQVVSANVANAMTEGYGRREIDLTARVVGGEGAGVSVDGIRRIVDEVLLRDRRIADADAGLRDGISAFSDRLSRLVGTPDNDSSITGRIRHLETVLITAASRPESLPRLQAVAEAAGAVAAELNAISEGITVARQDADANIAAQIGSLNRTLERISELNNDIARLNGAGRDVTALEDSRQRAIDSLSQIIPIREFPRSDGRIALISTGGAVLLDGSAPQFGFVPTPLITADMTLGSGSLSGLTLNGRPVSASGTNAPLSGGSLEAAFRVRDQDTVTAQARLDSLARDLYERFSDPVTDPTLTQGQAGLFTDGTGVFDPMAEAGLAGRIRLSALVDPATGGDLSLLRSGLGATLPADPGDATRLNALADALSALRLPASGDVANTARGASGLAADFQSLVQVSRQNAETELGFANARLEALKALEYSGGVDTDQEMQKLLLIERSYAANARVIQAVDDMLAQLTRI